MIYNKPPLTIARQIQVLQERGLTFEDKERAERYLSFISFYRFRAYTYPYQDNNSPDHPFCEGITFNAILNTYLFDRKLRLLVFDALERIEIALRTQIIYQYSISNGGYWFENKELFRKEHLFIRDLKLIDNDLNRSNEVFIKHYYETYSDPKRPPSWMTLETSTLGLLSKIYQNLRLNPEKKIIAKRFCLGHPVVLENWMHSLSIVRNICAHHGRLWNREIPTSMKFPTYTSSTWLVDKSFPHGRMYMVLSSILFLLNTIIPGNHFKAKLKTLLDRYPEIPLQHMGFPDNWKNEQLWKN